MELDLALHVDEPPNPTNASTPKEKANYDQWEQSNYLSLMLIKSHISKSIRGYILARYMIKAYMKTIEE